jgi:aryl-alcohol dehydrogenase-like predicted oxidoreductase
VAINWVRQQAPHVIPIVGARRPAQIADNLGALEFALSDEHLQRLAAANPLEPGFPHSFWNDFVRRDLVLGERADELG